MKRKPALLAAATLLLLLPAGCGRKLPTAVDSGQGFPRTVLVEVFTSEFCTNCPKADAAAEQLAAEMGDSLCLLELHPVTFQSSGDSLGIGAADTLVTAYEAGLSAQGLPLFVCDGVDKVLGTAADIPGTYATYRPVADVRKQKRSPVRIALNAQADQGALRYTATVTADASLPPSPNLGLVLAVVEDSVSAYGKQNRCVARFIYPNSKGEALALSASATAARSGSVPAAAGWRPDRLALIAYVRNNDTKEILQSAKVRIIAAAAPPAPPALDSPADGATGIGLNPTLSWNPSGGAASYALHVATDSAFGATLVALSGLTGTSQTLVNGLANATTYYWRVNASNNAGVSGWSAVRSFNTTAVPRPAPPVLLAPANGDTGVSKSPTLRWRAAAGASGYALQIATDVSFSSGAMVSSLAGLTDTSRPVLGLDPATLYYWRVSAANVAGASPWSGTWSFRTTANPAPDAPVLVSPNDGETNAGTGPLLAWGASSGAASYALQVSTTSTFASTVVNLSGLTGTSQALSGLPSFTTYYWRVNASDGNGASPWSAVWSFTDAQGFAFSRLTTLDQALQTPDTVLTYSLSNPPAEVGFQIYIMNLTPGRITIAGQSDTTLNSNPSLFWGQVCTEGQCLGPNGIDDEEFPGGSTHHWTVHFIFNATPPPLGLHHLTLSLWNSNDPSTVMNSKLYLNVVP